MNDRHGGKGRRHLLSCIVVFICLSAISWGVFAQQRVEPENKVQQPVESSRVLTQDGNRLSLSAKTLGNLTQEDQNARQEDQEKESEDTEKKGAKQDKKSARKGKSGDGQTGNNKGGQNTEGKTSTVYFTTSIKDGETVTARSYSFSIHHKIKTLTPKQTRIYVNERLAEDIADARTDFTISLREGENSVRVQVLYENENGQSVAPYKDYTLYADTRNLVIETSLQDGQKVRSPYLTFTAKASFGETDVDLLVRCGQEELSQIDGVYEAELKEGANLFTLSAEYDEKHKAHQTCNIYYEPPAGMHIETDLKNQTIRAERGDFSFRAEVVGGSAKAEFTVSVNNQTIQGENGVYETVLLPQSETAYNTIRLKARDGKDEDSQTFKIKYVPIATPETEPKLTHINIRDGQSINRKNPFTLELAAQDYKGGKIYFDGIEVSLNGSRQILRDTKPYITYKLNFTEGQNLVTVRVTDDDGRYKDYQYTIYYQSPDEDEKIGTVTVSVDANVLGLGAIISPTDVDLLAGDNAAKVILRTLEAKGYSCVYDGSAEQGFYLSKINRSGIGKSYNIPAALRAEINEFGIPWSGGEEDHPDHAADSLGERDYTTASGWMILVDGSFISESASAVDLQDGSIVKIRFSLAYGMDIGGSYQGQSFENTY